MSAEAGAAVVALVAQSGQEYHLLAHKKEAWEAAHQRQAELQKPAEQIGGDLVAIGVLAVVHDVADSGVESCDAHSVAESERWDLESHRFE